MRTVHDTLNKPSLYNEDELLHYGVKGMRWGVRRSQAELDRAAGRVGDSPTKNRGRTIKEARESRRQTKEARNKAAEKRNKEAQKVRDVVEKGTGIEDHNQEPNKSQRAALKKIHNSPEYKKAQADFKKADADFKKAMAEHQNNPDKANAARLTYGEIAITALLTTPVGLLTVVSISETYANAVEDYQELNK